MVPFTTAELAGMQATQQSAMMDTCVIEAFSFGLTDEYGKQQPVYTAGVATACGFDPNRHSEVMEGAQVAIADAQLRLPLATVIDQRDRVKVTHRFGVALSNPDVYEVIGEVARGPSGVVVDMRNVTDGSGT